MSDRIYNKLFLNENRTEGSEKLLLGYQNNEKEIILKKDQYTYFHIPSYTTPIKLRDSSLILDGATPGPYPAAADKIFKNLKSFGNSTANGTPSGGLADGTWFCSWLYKDPETGEVQWLDRFYNPGTIKLSISDMFEGPKYVKFNPIFRDVPSGMVFEPGVMYRYFHVGEKTAAELVTTFDGISSNKLVLDLKSWGNTTVDSLSTTSINITTNAPANEIYTTTINSNRVTVPRISFENTYDITARADFNKQYGLTEEFTLSFNAKSPNWNAIPTTQLVGNYSSIGGFGVFVHNLSSYPFFVVPETSYGHMLFVNENFNGFLDKTTRFTAASLSSCPQFISIDEDYNVLMCDYNLDYLKKGNILKIDVGGKVLDKAKINDVDFQLVDTTEQPIELFCGPNRTTLLRTNKNLYTFDSSLNLTNTLNLMYSLSSVSAYRYNSETNFIELDVTENVYDSKFIETTQWYTSRSDGNLYKKVGNLEPELFYNFSDIATSFSIDPNNRLWVLHGTNKLTIIDSTAEALSDPILETEIGVNLFHSHKRISFTCSYERSSDERTWYALIYYSDEPYIYVFNLNGELINSINTLSLFDQQTVARMKENEFLFRFLCKGDFTGYEYKRIFNTLSPYKNRNQIVVKAALKDLTKFDLTFEHFKQTFPIQNWENNSWQHFALILKNREFRLFVNGIYACSVPFAGNHTLSYELQPSLFIGTSSGSQFGINQETKYTTSLFNGMFEDIKIYNYAIEENKLESFLRAANLANDISWNLPVPSIHYIEKIERMFKNKLPGSKAPFYRIKLRGSQIQDLETRKLIEQQIKTVIEEIQPAYTELLEVHWVD